MYDCKVVKSLCNILNLYKHVSFLSQKGPGGSIQAMKFDPRNNNRVITASINGMVTNHDFEGIHTRILSDTMNCCEWVPQILREQFKSWSVLLLETLQNHNHLTLSSVTWFELKRNGDYSSGDDELWEW